MGAALEDIGANATMIQMFGLMESRNKWQVRLVKRVCGFSLITPFF